MNKPPFKTIMIGFGQIAQGLRQDARMAKYFTYATHAQALKDHPDFDWACVVDPDESAMEIAQADWGIGVTETSISKALEKYEPQVAVISTPPDARFDIIQQMPNIRAVLVEKPLGMSVSDSREFLNHCRQNNIEVHVNFWRRTDPLYRRLSSGELSERIGTPQAVFATYGNGLHNNGCHMIDFIQMLLGDIKYVQALGDARPGSGLPLKDDVQSSFALTTTSGIVVTVQPLDFNNYREVGIDIWGSTGRLSLYQEGLGIQVYPKSENRGLENEFEIASDNPETLEPTVGSALYDMYQNLSDTLQGGSINLSSGASALKTEIILEKLMASTASGGTRLVCD